ncbi:MAG: M48 family metallopeptidase [Ktedonobacteraceae bacterium]|nr:M48 family metallopeptidase [Ktedonobacteraceae bacterium]
MEQIDNERQQKAREYARIRRRLSLGSTAVMGIAAILLIVLQVDKWLRDQIQAASSQFTWLAWQPSPAYSDWYPVQILVYLVIVLLVVEIVTLPLSYYSGFVLSHRYGLSVMTLRAWIADLLKGGILGLILQAFLVSLIYALLAYQPQTWWLWVALFLLFFSVIMANLAPVLIFPLFYKFTPLPEGELTQRLLALAARANTRVRGVFTIHMSRKTTAANAALMGLGNTRRIVVGDTMLDRYTPDEIEVVLAHELGHHVHRDIWKMIALESVLMLVDLFSANLVLHWIVDVQHYYRSLTDPATLFFFGLLAGLFSLVIMPLNNAHSRHIERQADEYALQMTKKVEAFKSAMMRLANQNLSEINPSPLIEFLFYSHPSIARRLKHADEFAQRPGAGTATPQAAS